MDCAIFFKKSVFFIPVGIALLTGCESYLDMNIYFDIDPGDIVDVDVDIDTDSMACGVDYFSNWEEGRSPEEIGEKLAHLFNTQLISDIDSPITDKYGEVHYKIACAWYGALDVSDLTGDKSLKDELIAKYTNNQDMYEQYFDDYVFPTAGHVDTNVFGIVPLEIYMQNGDAGVLGLGVRLADHQIENKDHTDQKRYAIDDMFMVTGLQMQAYRATRDEKYLDFAAERMVEYLTQLQEPDGCFFQLQEAGIKWGRGNGWFAAGMAEILRELPQSHPQYPAILDGYKKMMAGLLNYQNKGDGDGAGLWNQVIDSDDPRNWPETSGSAMFTYAMIVGVELCILDEKTYGEAARKAWLALTDYLDQDGRLRDISNWCYWIPERGEPLSYYLERPSVVGDNHGQAPMLWAAAALMRYL